MRLFRSRVDIRVGIEVSVGAPSPIIRIQLRLGEVNWIAVFILGFAETIRLLNRHLARMTNRQPLLRPMPPIGRIQLNTDIKRSTDSRESDFLGTNRALDLERPEPRLVIQLRVIPPPIPPPPSSRQPSSSIHSSRTFSYPFLILNHQHFSTESCISLIKSVSAFPILRIYSPNNSALRFSS